ncbi:MAG: oxidoreductase [Azospirillum sp.]|nr:oxidoreductase [Azospirillum sp.]
MAPLPERRQLTVDAIYAAIEAKADNGYRDHLGASVIGNRCNRALWYIFRWATRAAFSGRMLRLFETGQLEESRIVKNLRAAGITILPVDPDSGRQWAVEAHGGHFGGSMDGVGVGFPEAPLTWHLTEMKTHNDKSFYKLVWEGVELSKPLHYTQMQIYMELAEIERAIYIAVNKNTDEIYTERVKRNRKFARRAIERAKRIIDATEPPAGISVDPSWFECRFCDHNAVCYGDSMPERHCRSCLSSSPVDGGWWCDRHSKHLSPKEQRAGCQNHLFIPALIAGEQIDADIAGLWVEYKLKDGSIWVDGAAP